MPLLACQKPDNSMKKTMKFLLPAAMLTLGLASLFIHTAKAQLDPGLRTYLYENGIRVGEVYVPDRAAGATEYVEDWVLYPNYLYPGPQFIGALQIVPSSSERPYASETDFFQRVPFAPGSKYIRVLAQEYTSLPGR
jgi:hypothetical protein